MSIVRRTAWLAAISTALALFATALIAALPGAPAWAATPGGISSTTYEPAPGEEAPVPEGPPGKARLVNGRAIPPADAPPVVREVIEAANLIRTKPYVWGGGHRRWWDRGYDCSGAVSFALYGGRLLSSPLTSGGLMRWGKPGKGRWITVYAHGGHTYAVIAGLRWDTSFTGGKGPRWSTKMRSPRGFVARHPAGL